MVSPSPAAAAGVSRILGAAGIARSTEIAGRLYTQGYDASLQPDHVRVEYANSPFGLVDVKAGLDRCEAVLRAKGYDVRRVVADVAVPGGWEEAEVLEVRVR